MGRDTFREKITTPELIKDINPKNIKLVDRFMRSFQTKKSDGTIKTYKSNFNMFFCWNILYNDNKFFIDVKKSDMMDFFDYGSIELQWGSNRFAQMWSSLNTLSNYVENLLDEDYPDYKNKVKKIEKPVKSSVRTKTVFTDEDLEKLADWLVLKDKKQELCLLKMLMASGCRISEIARLTVDIIDENNLAFQDLFIETTEKIRVKGRGKDGKNIHIYLLKDMFINEYKDWLPNRKNIMSEKEVDHNCIFIKRTGEPAEDSTFRTWMQKWNDIIGKDVYAHAFRHYNTTMLLKLGLDRELVQEMKKWTSDAMVQIYNDSTAKDREWEGLDKLAKNLKK